MKYDNVNASDYVIWNWSRSYGCDDAIIIINCINYGPEGEMLWPHVEERCRLGSLNRSF